MYFNILHKLRNMMLRTFASLWRRKMNLKGGVVIIGSLLWDNTNRCEWRKRSLETLETKIPVWN